MPGKDSIDNINCKPSHASQKNWVVAITNPINTPSPLWTVCAPPMTLTPPFLLLPNFKLWKTCRCNKARPTCCQAPPPLFLNPLDEGTQLLRRCETNQVLRLSPRLSAHPQLIWMFLLRRLQESPIHPHLAHQHCSMLLGALPPTTWQQQPLISSQNFDKS